MKSPIHLGIFSVKQRERNAILIIILLEMGYLFLPGLICKQPKDLPLNQIDHGVGKDSSERRRESAYHNNTSVDFSSHQQKITLHLFRFDPNELDSLGWEKLGLPTRTVRTIMNYRRKGGRFQNPEDIQKIWGIQENVAKQLIPYAEIKSTSFFFAQKNPSEHPIKKPLAWIDINTSDSAMWESLPGIGPVLAARIVAYRKKLGGFVTVSQLKEVWGLRDSTFDLIASRIKLNPEVVQKKDVNKATWEELKAHPYIGYKLANSLLRYRKQHGNFQTLNDIQQMLELDEEAFRRLQYYIMVSTKN